MVYSTENFYKTFESVRKLIPYKICIKGIDPEEILLRSSIKDLDESAAFIQAYEAVTHSRFKMFTNKSGQSSHVCRRKWICDHSVVSGINEKCPASINILIKKINKQNTLKDAFLRRKPPHPAVIKINPNHNHPLMIPLAPYKLLKVNNGVKECFYEYFKRGYNGARAKELHEQYLRKANFYSFEDESMNPTLPAIFALYNNWLKMQIDTASGSSSSQTVRVAGSLQGPSIQIEAVTNEANDEAVHLSSQNLETFINVEDIMSRIKKEPEDNYTAAESITVEPLEDIKPVLNIKQEIIDEDETDTLPIISSYGHVVTAPSVTLPPQTIVTNKTKSKEAKMTMQNVAAVVKSFQNSPSQVVVYDQSSNTYKVVKCLAVNTGSYSSSQYKSYLPNTLPSRISL